MDRIENPEQLDATMQKLQSEEVAERRDAGTQLSYVDRHSRIGFELAIPVILDKAANDPDVYVRERCVEAIRMAYSKITISNTILDAVALLALDEKEDDSKGWVRDRAQDLLLEVIRYDPDMRNIKKGLDALVKVAEQGLLTTEIKERLVQLQSKDPSHRTKEMATRILNAADARDVRTARPQLPANDVGVAQRRAVARVG